MRKNPNVARLKVVTLNIWNKSGPWPARCELIRKELEALRPDVVGLQEVLRFQRDGAEAPLSPENDQTSELAEGLGFELAYASAVRLSDGVDFGNALLSRFPIETSSRYALPGQESGETRCLLATRLATPYGGQWVFVTHLNWKLHHGSIRVRQVKTIADVVADLCPLDGPELPPILLGDFNAEPDSDEIRFLKGLSTIDGQSVHFADAWSYAGDGGPGYTFDRKNTFAARAHEPPRRIDYVFVRGPDALLRGEPLSTRLAFHVPSQDTGELVWPSDHFGLVTEIRITPPGSELDERSPA